MTDIGQKLLLAFEGVDRPSTEMLDLIEKIKPAGFTLFDHLNHMDSPAQVRGLTDGLQRIARDLNLPPFLIAVDQEGGQLTAIGNGTTPLPGNMALGAIGSAELAKKAGEVLGREVAAMGININYAPVCDVNINPKNPVIGIRSFGEKAEDVARLASAMVDGIQSQRTFATAKHFPGHGDTDGDSHHTLTAVSHPIDRLREVEFPPFSAVIDSDVKLIMTAHIAAPAVDGAADRPATLSPKILRGLLRNELGFEGVIVTDAMNMLAIRQGEFLGEDAIQAVNAGSDLLLMGGEMGDHVRVFDALSQAELDGQLDMGEVAASQARIAALRSAVPDTPLDLSVIGSPEHLAVAKEIAEKSITLVRDDAETLPLYLDTSDRVALVMPVPVDMTPADTSSSIKPQLGKAFREHHTNVDEFSISHQPREKETEQLLNSLKDYDLIVVGTMDAYRIPEQANLVRAVLALDKKVVIAALRLPYDLAVFPEAKTYICTYGIQAPSLTALAKVLFGMIPVQGSLPVSIPDLYPIGHKI